MAATERRIGPDRRRRDTGPPSGCSERRIIAERRLPKVVEKTISDTEWKNYFGRLERRQGGHAIDLPDRPENISGRLWSDF
jgi:hypothetical protein